MKINVKIPKKINIGEIKTGTPPYTLPIASKDVLGGIKVGENLTIEEDGTLNAKASGSVNLTDYPKKSEFKTINGQSLIGEGDIKIKDGSSSEIYSTEEQVIGKYKDGKTLYKTTIVVPISEETTTRFNDGNIDKIVDFNAIAYDGTNTLKLPHFMVEPDGTIPYVLAWWNKNKFSNITSLYTRCSEHYSGYSCEITFKFTKIQE